MLKLLNIFKAVLKNDFQILMRYKLNLLGNFFSIIFYLFILFFFSDTFEAKDNIANLDNQNSLFLFFLTGLLMLDLTISCSAKFPSVINFYQTSGIMDELISELKVFLPTIIFSIVTPFFISLTKFVIYLLLINFFVNEAISFSLSLFLLIPFVIIYLLSIIGIGLIACSLTILFKRGNPVIQFNSILTLSLTGAFIPVSQLGSMLDSLSYLLPAKHYLDIFREIVGLNKNPYTLTNFFYNKIKNNESFHVWSNAKRNLLDVEDAIDACVKIIRKSKYKSKNIINILNYRFIQPLEIIINFEKILKVRGNYRIKKIKQLKFKKEHVFYLKFKKNYLIKTLKKYYQ